MTFAAGTLPFAVAGENEQLPLAVVSPLCWTSNEALVNAMSVITSVQSEVGQSDGSAAQPSTKDESREMR